MFYEEENAFNTCMRPQGHTECFSGEKKNNCLFTKTPQGTFNTLELL